MNKRLRIYLIALAGVFVLSLFPLFYTLQQKFKYSYTPGLFPPYTALDSYRGVPKDDPFRDLRGHREVVGSYWVPVLRSRSPLIWLSRIVVFTCIFSAFGFLGYLVFYPRLKPPKN